MQCIVSLSPLNGAKWDKQKSGKLNSNMNENEKKNMIKKIKIEHVCDLITCLLAWEKVPDKNWYRIIYIQ